MAPPRIGRNGSADDGRRIRPARAGDITAIDKLYTSINWPAPGIIRVRDEFLLAHEGRRLRGVLLYWLEEPDLFPADDSDRAPYALARRLWVNEIATAPDARRSGVGRALMHAAAAIALEQQVPWMRTWPSPRGSDADRAGRVAFFTACGMSAWHAPGAQLEMLAHATAVADATVQR